MNVLYDVFTEAFLSKITDYDFLSLDDSESEATIDGYMKRALTYFKKNCKYDFNTTANDDERRFDVEVDAGDIDEIADIVSEGMIVQWLKPYIYKQELLKNTLNTRDFTTYSPAELLSRVGNAYKEAQNNYTQLIREYSYNHGDLTHLHL